MKKICKIMFVLLIIANICLMTNEVHASGGLSDIWQSGQSFLDKGTDTESWGDKVSSFLSDFTARSRFNDIISFIWGLGLLVVFISTVVLGIKYMLVSPNEKSRIKQATTPYLIGTIIIFGALTIWRLIIDMLEGSMLGR